MRAARCESYGSPSAVTVVDLPDPTPGEGQVLVAVRAAAVNFPDVLTVADRYQITVPLPFTPGSEFAGTVLAVGAGCDGVRPGDAVMGTTHVGAFAEQVAVPATSVSPIPPGLDMVHAAGFQVTFRTAYHALVTIGAMSKDDWVVVLGAAGGVGTACVDIAARLGAKVVAAASTRARLRTCEELGATATVDYGQQDLKSRIKEITGGGADVVIDPVGGDYAEPALRAMRWGGRYVCVGFASGEIPRIPLNLVLLKGVIVRGFEIRTLPEQLPHECARAELDIAELVAAGARPIVSEVFALDDTATALQRVADRDASGKIVIEVGEGA